MVIKTNPTIFIINIRNLNVQQILRSNISFLDARISSNSYYYYYLKSYAYFNERTLFTSILILLLSFFSNNVNAQLENHIFNSPLTTAIEQSGLKSDSQSNIRIPNIYSSWMFKSKKFMSPELNISDPFPYMGKNAIGLTSLNYFKNNEYSEFHNPGETLLGTQLIIGLNNVNLKHKERYFREEKKSNRPKLLQSRMNLGLLLNYQYGGNQVQVFPLMNIQYFFSRSYFNFGSLNSNTNHRLTEAIYNYEYTFTKPIEYGIEFRKFSKRLDFNTWLEFRQLAIRKTSQQEIIAFGNRFYYHIITGKHHNFGRVTIPIQTMIYHRGGEALAVGKPINTLVNYATGLKYTSNRNYWNTEILYLGANDISPEPLKTQKNGHAIFLNTTVHFNQYLGMVLSYFNGYNYSSPLGARLFSNEYVSINDNRSHRRQLIQTRLFYSKQIPNTPSIIDIRVEPIYILDRNQFAFSTGLYFKYIIGHYTY